MKEGDVEECVRKCVEINGENYYILVGKTFVSATVPFENRPERMEERRIVESICDAVTSVMSDRVST
jgi:hypothetical protein